MSVATAGVFMDGDTVALIAMARRLKQRFMGHHIDDKATRVEDFIEGLKHNRKIINALVKQSFDEAGGDPGKQNYKLRELQAKSAEIEAIQDREDQIWNQIIEVDFRPILLDTERVKDYFKHLHRNDEGWKYDFAKIWPETLEVEHRSTKFNRRPYFDFLDLLFEGFVFTDSDDYDLATTPSEEPESEGVVKQLNKTVNKKK
ncbi:MAG: hypothetical protein E6R03_09805 [Hyphomicrobiaceae bacterium]|nr:MAG: hypothetical protein E6R03_09805 [Hyphomicrobiaceae bacterium]